MLTGPDDVSLQGKTGSSRLTAKVTRMTQCGPAQFTEIRWFLDVVIDPSCSRSSAEQDFDYAFRRSDDTNWNVKENLYSCFVLRVTIPLKREGHHALVCLDRGSACCGGDGRGRRCRHCGAGFQVSPDRRQRQFALRRHRT